MQWNTAFTRLFPAQLPIMGAPMAGASGGLLAAEVTKAGGLGFLAAGHLNSKEALHNLEQEIEIFQEESSSPLCIGFIGHSTFATEQGWNLFEIVLENYQPNCVQFFAPAISYQQQDNKTISSVELSHSYGCKVIAQVGSEEEGIQALKAGADCLIAQGTEAGGHGVRRELGCGTLTLTSRLVKQAEGKVPVLAAGGIVDGHGLVSALSLGADGVVLGSRLWASLEAKGSSAYKDALVATTSADQVVRTRTFDAIWNSYRSTKWPAPYDSSGALRNKITESWDDKISKLEKELERREESDVVKEFQAGCAASNLDLDCVFGGKGVASIDAISPVSEIINNIELEAQESLNRLHSLVEGT